MIVAGEQVDSQPQQATCCPEEALQGGSTSTKKASITNIHYEFMLIRFGFSMPVTGENVGSGS